MQKTGVAFVPVVASDDPEAARAQTLAAPVHGALLELLQHVVEQVEVHTAEEGLRSSEEEQREAWRSQGEGSAGSCGGRARRLRVVRRDDGHEGDACLLHERLLLG